MCPNFHNYPRIPQSMCRWYHTAPKLLRINRTPYNDYALRIVTCCYCDKQRARDGIEDARLLGEVRSELKDKMEREGNYRGNEPVHCIKICCEFSHVLNVYYPLILDICFFEDKNESCFEKAGRVEDSGI